MALRRGAGRLTSPTRDCRRQLLTHTAGFGYGNGDPDLARWAKHIGRNHDALQGTVEQWDIPLKFAPGQGWYYGTNIDWAGHVLEKVTGQTLGEYMAQHLFKPLGMNDSSFRRDALPHVQDRLVPTSHRDPETGTIVSGKDFPWPLDPKAESGGAGLYTTSLDYAKLLHALVKEGDGPGGLFQKKGMVEEMFKPQLTDIQRSWLKFIMDLFHDGLIPDLQSGMPLDYGISGAINMEDEPGKRKKGSMKWGGMCNSHWVSKKVSGKTMPPWCNPISLSKSLLTAESSSLIVSRE